MARWDRFFHIIEENDPTRHLKSIHNGEETMNFDHRKPWIDHVCIQNWNVKRTADWRREWGKPIVNDELEYEGDISLALGDLTPQELTHRFWVTMTRGGYADTVNATPILKTCSGGQKAACCAERAGSASPSYAHPQGGCRQWPYSVADR